MKKIILILIMLLAFCSFVSADLNLTTVTMTNLKSKDGFPYIWYVEDFQLQATYTDFTGNVQMYCKVIDGTIGNQIFTGCKNNGTNELYNIENGCLLYYINDTSSPIITLRPSERGFAFEGGQYSYYCHICNTTGFCDNSTYSGYNYGTFYVTNSPYASFVFLDVMIILIFLGGMFGIFVKSETKNKPKVYVGIIITLGILYFVTRSLLFGF